MAKILVVDDSKMLRDMVVYALNEGGYSDDVVEAEDGVDGLNKAKLSSFDLVLTDINMPNMDGFELTTALRADMNYKNRPILVLTTESGDDLKLKGKECGATGWIVKPFVPEELLYVVDLVLSR